MPVLEDRSLPSPWWEIVFLSLLFFLSYSEIKALNLHRDMTLQLRAELIVEPKCRSTEHRRQTYSRLDLKYRYKVGEVEYYGGVYDVSSYSPDECREIASEILKNGYVDVFVDRHDPGFSVVRFARRPFLLWVTIPAIATLFVFIFRRHMTRLKRSNRAASR
jgi:hypothetical protein